MATENEHFAPNEIIDLGTVVTDDLPQRFWGKAFLGQMNFTAQNSADAIRRTFPVKGGSVSGSNIQRHADEEQVLLSK